jgi:hypothetical protein
VAFKSLAFSLRTALTNGDSRLAILSAAPADCGSSHLAGDGEAEPLVGRSSTIILPYLSLKGIIVVDQHWPVDDAKGNAETFLARIKQYRLKSWH